VQAQWHLQAGAEALRAETQRHIQPLGIRPGQEENRASARKG